MNNSVICYVSATMGPEEGGNPTRAGGGWHIVSRDYCVAKLLLKERNVLGTKHQGDDGRKDESITLTAKLRNGRTD